MFFLQTNKYSHVFNSKDRCLCIKLNFFEMTVTTLGTDERGDRSCERYNYTLIKANFRDTSLASLNPEQSRTFLTEPSGNGSCLWLQLLRMVSCFLLSNWYMFWNMWYSIWKQYADLKHCSVCKAGNALSSISQPMYNHICFQHMLGNIWYGPEFGMPNLNWECGWGWELHHALVSVHSLCSQSWCYLYKLEGHLYSYLLYFLHILSPI